MNQTRRRRGTQLSPSGLRIVQERIDWENLSYEALAGKAELGTDVVRRLMKRQAVDRASVIAIAKVLDLRLTDIIESEREVCQPTEPVAGSEDQFYVECPAVEAQCLEALAKPGALLRIKAPQKMGKTLLMVRLLSQMQSQAQTAILSFDLADKTVFSSLKGFSQWFCAAVSAMLNLENRLSDYWDDILACNFNINKYFQRYILINIESSLILALDNTDLVFENIDIAIDFCKLLRGWHDQARRGDLSSQMWQKLHLVIVHDTEVYGSLDINTSPLAGVGTVVELPEFEMRQALQLAQRYEASWTLDQIKQLMDLVGGHPYLLQGAFEAIRYQNYTVEQILKSAPTESGIYRAYLRQLLNSLEQTPELNEAFQRVVAAQEPTPLKPATAFKLHSMGLIKLEGEKARPRCRLYTEYFGRVGIGG
jgi:hypothetical protein